MDHGVQTELIKNLCGVCGHSGQTYYVDHKTSAKYYKCPECELIFLDDSSRYNAADEKARYQLHQNNIHDLNYQKFVDPAYQYLKSSLFQGAKLLDYGCGEGPVLSHLLQKDGFEVSLYDPYFCKNEEALQNQYDFIFATEVIEHFYHPGEEFKKLRKLLRPQGQLVLMTHFWDEKTDFESWYYRKDPTHVSFYSKKTMDWIQANMNFSRVQIFSDRLAGLFV